jgi:hypothetical protein
MACFGLFDGPIGATILAGLGLIHRPDQGEYSVVQRESFLIGFVSSYGINCDTNTYKG